MILTNTDLTLIKPKAHAALDKRLNSLKSFGKQLTITIGIADLFNFKSKPIVFITNTAQDKMDALVDSCATEIAWHGLVKKETTKQGDVYTIYDIIVYPQVATGGTVEAVDNVGMWYMEQPDEVFNFIRMQGHSHVGMAVLPSGTDTNYYNRLLTQVDDYYIFMILNKRNSIYIELHDVANGIIYEEADILLDYEEEKENPIQVWADEQIIKQLYTADPAPITPIHIPLEGERPGTHWYEMSMNARADLVGMERKEYEAWIESIGGYKT